MQAWQATLAIFFCHILTGTASVITRYLINVLEPVEIAFMRYFFGGLILLPLFFLYQKEPISKGLLLKIIGLGILFFALFPFLFSWAYVYTTAARGSLVLATMPIWTMLIGKAMGHERLNRLQIIAMVLTLSGLSIALADKLFVAPEQAVRFKGEIIMILTAMIGALYAILSRRVLKQVSASVMTPLAMIAACLCLSPFVIVTGIEQRLLELSSLQLWLLIYLGIFAGGLAFFLFNWALIRSTATYTSLFVTLNPITAILLAALFLGEAISINFVVGILVVFSGLAVAAKSQTGAAP